MIDDLLPFIKIIIDLLADTGQFGRHRRITSAGNKTFSRLAMKIIPYAVLLASLAEKGAHVGFIRTLILTEPHISVDAEHAILGLQSCNSRVECGNVFNDKLNYQR